MCGKADRPRGYSGHATKRVRNHDPFCLAAGLAIGSVFGLCLGKARSSRTTTANPFLALHPPSAQTIDAEWELIVTNFRQENEYLKDNMAQMIRREDLMEACHGLDSAQPTKIAATVDKTPASSSCLPCPNIDSSSPTQQSLTAQMTAVQQKTHYSRLGVLKTETILKKYFSGMVPVPHPEGSLLVANPTQVKRGRQGLSLKPDMSMSDTQSCSSLSFVFTGQKRGTCTVLVPIDRDVVSRFTYRHIPDGKGGWIPAPKAEREASRMPTPLHRQRHEEYLTNLFKNLPDLERTTKRELAQLQGIAAAANSPQARTSSRATVKIMILNAGNIPVFVNLACSAAAADIDLRPSLLIFVADKVAEKSVQRLGYRTLFHKGFGELPSGKHAMYGDTVFMQMMWLKTVSGWLINRLGYDFLYLDSDLLWWSDPMQLIQEDPHWDIVFQDDGARSDRFSPYFGNSGFFFVRANPRTRHLMQMTLFSWELMLSWQSHQSVLSFLIDEHHLRNGLSIKTLPLDLLPTGKVFHHQKDLMAKLVSGQQKSYIFHMNWTLNNQEKLKYFRDIGAWYVGEQCMDEEHGLAATVKSLDYCCITPSPPMWPFNVTQDNLKIAR